MKLKQYFVFFFLIMKAICYLEMKLVRVPNNPKKVIKYGMVQCLSKLPPQQNRAKQQKVNNEKKQDSDDDNDDDEVEKNDDFQEVCYEKDISYAVELYNQQKQLMLLSLDLTTPISWLKGGKCKISGTRKQCTRIETSLRQQVESIERKFKSLLKKTFHRKRKQSKKDNEYALIQGSSEVVKGIMEKTKPLSFDIRDSGRLTRLLDVFLVGLAFMDITDTFTLKNTSFINATTISPNLNFLCDGAISLRFDSKSQSSFINQMMILAQSSQKYVTIYVGQNNQSITIGDLSVKNSAHGLSGIQWVPLKQQQNGKLASMTQLVYTEEGKQKRKSMKCKLPIVLTLSSSCIAIPGQFIKQMISKFFKKEECSINKESKYLQCNKINKTHLKQGQLNFVVNEIDIMIPLKQLVLENKRHHAKFNIKQALDKDYVIFGEPIFKRYFIVLDYSSDRLGFSLQRTKFVEQLLNVVYLIRFVIWFFCIGCVIIIFSNPFRQCYYHCFKKVLFSGKNGITGATGEKRRLREYRRVEDDGYDDLKGKIQEIVSDNVEGI